MSMDQKLDQAVRMEQLVGNAVGTAQEWQMWRRNPTFTPHIAWNPDHVWESSFCAAIEWLKDWTGQAETLRTVRLAQSLMDVLDFERASRHQENDALEEDVCEGCGELEYLLAAHGPNRGTRRPLLPYQRTDNNWSGRLFWYHKRCADRINVNGQLRCADWWTLTEPTNRLSQYPF